MTPQDWLCIGIFIGTLLSFGLTKKKDFRTGLSVGIGAAILFGAFTRS